MILMMLNLILIDPYDVKYFHGTHYMATIFALRSIITPIRVHYVVPFPSV